jgi:hypothetical protein
MKIQDMSLDQLKQALGEMGLLVGVDNSIRICALYSEVQARVKSLYDVYDVRIKSKQPEFTWDMIYPIPVRGESKRHAAQSTKDTHLLAIQTDAVIMVTERGMNPVTGEVFTMSDLD